MKNIRVNKNRKQTAAAAVLFFILAFLPAVAYSAPAWQGEERTTFEQWSFSEPYDGPVNPDPGWVNDYGTPALDDASSQWSPFMGLRAGISILTGEIDIFIPNYPVIQPEKEMWVELVWRAGDVDFSRLPSIPILGVETDIGYDRLEIEKQNSSLEDNWVSTLYKIHIWPNPQSEWITIKGDIYVDRVTVDTRCIPEPATIMLLGLGMALGLRRKRNA